MLNRVCIWLLTAKSPFEILGDPETNKVETTLGVEGTDAFSLVDIFVLMRGILIYGSIPVMLGTGIAILFIKKDERKYGEQKEKITNILTNIWLFASSVTFFNILKALFDALFGF